MMTIICGDITCKFNQGDECMNKKIELTYCSVNTVYQGKQKYLKCNNYEESEENKRIRKFLEKIDLGE